MRSLPGSLALFALALAPACAQLSQGERDRALSELHASRKQFLDSVANLSPAQWNFKPGSGRWSVRECAEHIALTEDFLFDLITKKLMQSPADPAKKALVKGKDEQVLRESADRSRKLQAPEPVVPRNQFATGEAAVEHFKASRDRMLDYVRTTKDDLRNHFGEHPAYGTLDTYQLVLLTAGHTERHTAQLNEVKADPNFPQH